MAGEIAARIVTESEGGAPKEINDLPRAASLNDKMQFEIDVGGTLSLKGDIGQLKNYINNVAVPQDLVDITDEIYWYFGVLFNGAWRINRYDVTQDSQPLTQATEANNSGFTDMTTAWAARVGLNYGSS